jgi:hypothetical protein
MPRIAPVLLLEGAHVASDTTRAIRGLYTTLNLTHIAALFGKAVKNMYECCSKSHMKEDSLLTSHQCALGCCAVYLGDSPKLARVVAYGAFQIGEDALGDGVCRAKLLTKPLPRLHGIIRPGSFTWGVAPVLQEGHITVMLQADGRLTCNE